MSLAQMVERIDLAAVRLLQLEVEVCRCCLRVTRITDVPDQLAGLDVHAR